MRSFVLTPQAGRDLEGIWEYFADDRHRFWPVLSYLIMYRHGTRPLQILRIVSGYRDLIALLNPPA